MNKNSRRSGAVLICVLVVLLIVGLISAQTIQTLLMIRRSDAARSRLRQAQELVELGRIVVQQHGAAALPESVEVALDDQSQAKIVLRYHDDGVDGKNSDRQVLRILVKYPADSTQEVSVTGSVTVNTKDEP